MSLTGTGSGRQKPDYPHFPVSEAQGYPKPPSFLKMESLFIFSLKVFQSFNIVTALLHHLQKDDINLRSHLSSKSGWGLVWGKCGFSSCFLCWQDIQGPPHQGLGLGPVWHLLGKFLFIFCWTAMSFTLKSLCAQTRLLVFLYMHIPCLCLYFT